MIDLHADLQDGELLELPGLAADADADAAAAFLEEYGFTADREDGYTIYYLCFSPSGSYTSGYSQNWITLYDYDQDGRIDSVTLDYEHPFSR